jgi:hypothetical protein
MADYYNFQQVVQMCGIAESTLEQLPSKGLLEPTLKRGRPFLSSQQSTVCGSPSTKQAKEK